MVMNVIFQIKHLKSKGMQEKEIKHECSVRIENSVPQQSLVMQNSDPWDGIFFPHLTPM